MVVALISLFFGSAIVALIVVVVMTGEDTIVGVIVVVVDERAAEDGVNIITVPSTVVLKFRKPRTVTVGRYVSVAETSIG